MLTQKGGLICRPVERRRLDGLNMRAIGIRSRNSALVIGSNGKAFSSAMRTICTPSTITSFERHIAKRSRRSLVL